MSWITNSILSWLASAVPAAVSGDVERGDSNEKEASLLTALDEGKQAAAIVGDQTYDRRSMDANGRIQQVTQVRSTLLT